MLQYGRGGGVPPFSLLCRVLRHSDEWLCILHKNWTQNTVVVLARGPNKSPAGGYREQENKKSARRIRWSHGRVALIEDMIHERAAPPPPPPYRSTSRPLHLRPEWIAFYLIVRDTYLAAVNRL